MVVEDLHWLDPSTLDYERLLAEQGAMVPLMLLCTARPEFRPQWPLRAHHTQITLNRLSARDVREMVSLVAARNALAGETVNAVIERTGGVPLFVEELTRAVLESGTTKLSGREIPVTLHDSLMARLDRLGSAKEVIQVGAVIGSEFSYELLQAVCPITGQDLQTALRSATDAELIYARGIAPDATYRFKHTLIRDAAYEALLKSRRKELHRRMARTIEEKFPALKETHPELLARHWTEADETEHATAEWERAGGGAERRGAFREALDNYQQALALLNLLPESEERDVRELELRQSIVAMLQVTRGYSAAETSGANELLAALAEKSGSLKRLVNWAWSRWAAAYVADDFPAAEELADQAVELGLREGSATSLGVAHALQIQTRYIRGDLTGAEEHFTVGLEFFDDPGLVEFPAVTVLAFGFAIFNAWSLGRLSLAHEREVRMMAAANVNNPHDMAFSCFFSASLRVLMGEYKEAEALAERALELSEKHRFPFPAALSRCILGETRAQLRSTDEGVELIRQGIAGLLEIGARVAVSAFITYLAAAQEREGAMFDAFETVEQALQTSPYETIYRPEALRLRGELRLRSGQAEPAEADLRDSVALARSMSAKAWELRATMSLARLLSSQGRCDEARTMLADIYGWFTEGFDTADLKEAKALLDELSQ